MTHGSRGIAVLRRRLKKRGSRLRDKLEIMKPFRHFLSQSVLWYSLDENLFKLRYPTGWFNIPHLEILNLINDLTSAIPFLPSFGNRCLRSELLELVLLAQAVGSV